MSDAEDTEAVPTTPGITATTLPTDEVTPSANISINVPPIEIANPSTKQIKPSSSAPSKHEAVGIPEDSKENGKRPKENKKQDNKTEAKKLQPCPPPQSRCKVRSRDMRQCKKHFREMIGKHEIRNDELEQRETDLRQRMEMLECSMPAVMVWNIWRQAQGAPVSHLREIVEKQFVGPAAGFAACPSTPSQHWDCRVREVEAERKQALHRAEEARQVFAVKGDALKLQKQQIEEARRLQDERKIQIAKLEEEVKRLQDALKKAQGDENFCETGECGEIKCREMWLQDVSSVSSIHSTDLECLTRLQDLAEAELCMKRQIADLERRECAYMRTLQQADEMWSKMEDENASSLGNLKEQLEAKIAANQQLADRIVELEDDIEKLRTQLNKALATLDEYKSKTFADVGFGDVNISTEEKIEQTDEEVQEIKVSDECRAEDIMVTEETRLSKSGVAKTEEIEQPPKNGDTEYTPIEQRDESELKGHTTVEKTSISDPGVRDGQLNYEPIQVTSKISTTEEESVQAYPGSEDVETQSIVTEPGLDKETATEERSQAGATTITEAVAEIGREVLPGQEQQRSTVPGEVLEVNEKHIDVPVADVNSSNPFENMASLDHLLKAPTEDKDTGVSVATRIEDNSTNQKEAFQLASEVSAQPIFTAVTGPAYEKASESTLRIRSRKVDEIVSETTPEPTTEPIAKVSVKAAPELTGETRRVATGSSINSPFESVIETDLITFTEVAKEAVPQIVSETKPRVSPLPSIAATPGPVLEPATKPAIDVVLIPPSAPVIEIIERPVLEPILEVIEPVQGKLAENTLAIPIQTLLSWHDVTACLRKQISTCPQCSSTSRDIKEMLEEMRTYLGKDAPELADIECAKVKEEVQNSVPLSTKKGPCICKPRSCPLDGPHAAEPAQANVQIQTVVDGHSQTSMPVKIPNRESRSSKSKGSPKSKEEVKLTSIEEGTEPDPGMRRAKSIPEARDESTVTVGDIASQTEPIRKIPSVSKEEEKPCVCPTGVCPKKKARPESRGECTLGKIFTRTKKAIGKEYKSTADAIFAPAIKVLPSNEPASSPTLGVAKADDAISESSSFACCMCGKPATPVASRKTTSIPMPTKSVFKSKVMVASEGSDDDFLCCSCRAKDSPSERPKYSLLSKSPKKSSDIGRHSKRVNPASKVIKTSCSREICCPCENQEIHVLTKTLTTELEVSKSKTRPETKDVCCLAKISRDKVSKTESRRRKDKDSIKTATPSVSNSGSGQLSSSSSTHKGSRTNDSSDSNVCCSSIEQVMDITKRKGKGKKCACDGQEGKNKNERCVCGEDNEPMLSKEAKYVEPSDSCSCPPKLFDKC